MSIQFRPLDDLYAYMQDEAKHDDHIGSDGCYYCGGSHPTDCCQSQDRDEFYRDLA